MWAGWVWCNAFAPGCCSCGAKDEFPWTYQHRPELMRSTDADDKSPHFFRSQERLFCFNSQWYFSTREGDCGPFPTKEIARSEVTRYITERSALRGFQESRKMGLTEGRRSLDLSLSLVPLD